MKLLLLSIALIGCVTSRPDIAKRESCVRCNADYTNCWPVMETECLGKKRDAGFEDSCTCHSYIQWSNEKMIGHGDCWFCGMGGCREVEYCENNREAFPFAEKRPVYSCNCENGPCMKCNEGVCKQVSSCDNIYKSCLRCNANRSNCLALTDDACDEKREGFEGYSCDCTFKNGVGGCTKCENGNCIAASSCNNGKREAEEQTNNNNVNDCNNLKYDRASGTMVKRPCKRETVAVEKREEDAYSCSCTNGACTECFDGVCSQVSSCSRGKRESCVQCNADRTNCWPVMETECLGKKREAGWEEEDCNCDAYILKAPKKYVGFRNCRLCETGKRCRKVEICYKKSIGKRENAEEDFLATIE